MVTDFLSAPFLQMGCARKAAEQIIRFTCGDEADPTIQQLVCIGEITIESTKGGVATTATYAAGTHDELQIDADANTEVVIRGDVTELYVTKWDEGDADYISNISLASFDASKMPTLQELCVGGTDITSLDLSNNAELIYLDCGNCQGLTSLDLTSNTKLELIRCRNANFSAINLTNNTEIQTLDCAGADFETLDLTINTKLQTLDCHDCQSLVSIVANTAIQALNCQDDRFITSLDLSSCTSLSEIDFTGCTALTSISYPATNSDVSDAIAAAITAATAADGTVYTDSTGAYYSTIATAATAKGWTVAPLA